MALSLSELQEGIENDRPIDASTYDDAPIVPVSPRRRGRPRGSKNVPKTDEAPALSLDASEYATSDPVEPVGPKRRTPKLSRASAIKNSAKGLVGVHKIAAKVIHPDWEISDDEGMRLADATFDLADAYGVSMEKHPKAIATFNFATAVAEIEGPRIAVSFTRGTRRKQYQPQQGDDPVLVLPDDATW